MRLGLIGMSGVGKTYWADRLAAAGFHCIHCDDLISARLRAAGAGAVWTLEDQGDWLGMPYEARYPAREAQYLQYEHAILEDILAGLRAGLPPAAHLVVDMGGSAIYAGAPLFAELRRFLTMVYLAITPAVHEQMLRAYLAHPRSLIWRGVDRAPGAAMHPDTLAADYRRLIAFREELYAAFSDVQIPYEVHRRPQWPVAAFLAQIPGAIPG